MKGKIEEQVEEVRWRWKESFQPCDHAQAGTVGYTQKEMKVGRGLIKNVELLTTNQEDGQGSQKDATRQLQAARKELHTTYKNQSI